MKILMMTNTYLPHVGGVARSVHTFTEDYRKMGHEVTVVAPTFPGVEEMDPDLEKGVIRVPAVQRFNGSDFSVRVPLVGWLDERLLRSEPDIVHSHHPFLLGDTALRIGANKHTPVIFTHHTLYEEYLHYVPFPGTRMRHFVIELSTHYANLCDAVIAPSESIATLIRKRGVHAPVHVIPTGIDLKKFAGGVGERFRRLAGIGEDRFVVGTLGRLAPEKNLDFLAGAVVEFLKERPDAVFLVVGEGPSEIQIGRLFEKAGLQDRLFMPGKQSGQNLFDAYRAMDLFAFSSFSETQGLVLAEAMAAGLPVVALDASGVREVLRDKENGFMLPAEAGVGDFATALGKLYDDPSLREKLREAAFGTAEEFGHEICARKALDLYESTTRQTAPKRAHEADDVWAGLLHRLKVEWDLISEKAESAFGAFRSEDEPEESSSGDSVRR